jgi:glycerophosphoryl diester phosphodiesterase
LLVEIKSEWHPPQKSFLARLTAAADAYSGPVALMSFDPAVMTVIRELAPRLPRGIISGSYLGAGWWSRRIGAKRATALRDLLESGPVAPDFYAYDVNALPTPVTEYARLVQGLPLFTWTVRSAKQRRIAASAADAMIFEGFEPYIKACPPPSGLGRRECTPALPLQCFDLPICRCINALCSV